MLIHLIVNNTSLTSAYNVPRLHKNFIVQSSDAQYWRYTRHIAIFWVPVLPITSNQRCFFGK